MIRSTRGRSSRHPVGRVNSRPPGGATGCSRADRPEACCGPTREARRRRVLARGGADVVAQVGVGQRGTYGVVPKDEPRCGAVREPHVPHGARLAQPGVPGVRVGDERGGVLNHVHEFGRVWGLGAGLAGHGASVRIGRYRWVGTATGPIRGVFPVSVAITVAETGSTPRLRYGAERETGRAAQQGTGTGRGPGGVREAGVEAPLDVIARRAGVGNATLYRRFPDRAALIEAVFQDGLAATHGRGRDGRGRDRPDGRPHRIPGARVRRTRGRPGRHRPHDHPSGPRAHAGAAPRAQRGDDRPPARALPRRGPRTRRRVVAGRPLRPRRARPRRPGRRGGAAGVVAPVPRAVPGRPAHRRGARRRALPGDPYDPATLRDALGALHISATPSSPAPRPAPAE